VGLRLERYRALSCETRHESSEFDAQGRREWRTAAHPAAQADRGISRRLEKARTQPHSARVGKPKHLSARERPRLRLFRAGKHDRDQIGFIDANTRAVFGRSYVGEPDVLAKELAGDEAIAAADTLLMTIPNTLGVDYNVHVIESVLKYVAPELGWR
jgi:hypothetical protein